MTLECVTFEWIYCIYFAFNINSRIAERQRFIYISYIRNQQEIILIIYDL